MLGSDGQSITEPTFTGFVDSTYDALILFEAALRGVVSKTSRRLQEKERHLIRSGSVFIFDEKESGIKRWTDGLLWSPSRILGNFLIYRELDSREPFGRGTGLSAQDVSPRSGSTRDRCLTNSTYRFKTNGLVKKTVSLADMHIICYYRVNDVVDGRFRHPSSIPELVSLDISPYLLSHQNFRVPVKIEFGPDAQPRFAGETDDSSNNNTLGVVSAPSSSAISSGFKVTGLESSEASQSDSRPSPVAFRPLSLDPPADLQQDYDQHTQASNLRVFTDAGPSTAAPTFAFAAPQPTSTVSARPPNVRSYSNANLPGQAARPRFEPYPPRSGSNWTAPASPVSMQGSLPLAPPFMDNWVPFQSPSSIPMQPSQQYHQHQQQQSQYAGSMWKTTSYYVPQPPRPMEQSPQQTQQQGSQSPSGGQRRLPHHRHSLSHAPGPEWTLEQSAALLSPNRPSSNRSSTSSGSIELSPGSGGFMGMQTAPRSRLTGAAHMSMSDPIRPTTLAPGLAPHFHPLSVEEQDRQPTTRPPTLQQSDQTQPSAGLPPELSGHFQQLDTQSDLSSSPSSFDGSRQNSGSSVAPHSQQQQQQQQQSAGSQLSYYHTSPEAISLNLTLQPPPSICPTPTPTFMAAPPPLAYSSSTGQQHASQRQDHTTHGGATSEANHPIFYGLEGDRGSEPARRYEMPLRSSGMVVAAPPPAHADPSALVPRSPVTDLPQQFGRGAPYSWPNYSEDDRRGGSDTFSHSQSMQEPMPSDPHPESQWQTMQ